MCGATFGNGKVVVVMEEDGCWSVLVSNREMEPSAGDLAEEVIREEAARIGMAVMPCLWDTMTIYERAQAAYEHRAWLEALDWLKERGLTLSEDEPEDTPMGELYAAVFAGSTQQHG